jgi:hypothetical protein
MMQLTCDVAEMLRLSIRRSGITVKATVGTVQLRYAIL